MVDVKIRRIGNSLGAVFPAEALRELGVEEGDEVAVAIFKKRRGKLASLKEIAGLAVGAGPFEREKEDRFD